MTGKHDLATMSAWLDEGTIRLLAALDRLGDDELAEPSLLPGWTRAHVVAHLARNAEALIRLATWARTGVETPMYTDKDQRAAEIEESSRLPAAVLRDECADTARALSEALGLLDRRTWAATVRSAMGRTIPAAEIPWLRVRELWLHEIDLGTGATPAELPAGIVDLLLDDTTTMLSGKTGCPGLVLAPADRQRKWQLGDGAGPVVDSLPAVTLAAWLTGRGTKPGLPELPAWL